MRLPNGSRPPDVGGEPLATPGIRDKDSVCVAVGGPPVPQLAELPWGHRAAAQGMVALAAGLGTVNLAVTLPATVAPLRSLGACALGWGAANAAAYFAAGHVWAPRALRHELEAASAAAGAAAGAFLTAGLGDRTHEAAILLLRGSACTFLSAFSAGSMRYQAEAFRRLPEPKLVSAGYLLLLHAVNLAVSLGCNLHFLFATAARMGADDEALAGLPDSTAAQQVYALAAVVLFLAGPGLAARGLYTRSATASACGALLATCAALPLVLCALARQQPSD